jgi:hypothetical protein
MIEFSIGEIALFCWAVLATGYALNTRHEPKALTCSFGYCSNARRFETRWWLSSRSSKQNRAENSTYM